MQMPSPIGPLNSGLSKIHGPHGINAPHAPIRGQGSGGAAKTQAVGDQFTISPAAEEAIQATETGGISQDEFSRVRSENAAGTYETPAKLDSALSRLLDEIG
jgi:hypothetical protein